MKANRSVSVSHRCKRVVDVLGGGLVSCWLPATVTLEVRNVFQSMITLVTHWTTYALSKIWHTSTFTYFSLTGTLLLIDCIGGMTCCQLLLFLHFPLLVIYTTCKKPSCIMQCLCHHFITNPTHFLLVLCITCLLII